jgi:DNA adenine methylase
MPRKPTLEDAIVKPVVFERQLYERLSQMAQERGSSISALVRELLKKSLEAPPAALPAEETAEKVPENVLLEVAEEVARYTEEEFQSGGKIKPIQYPGGDYHIFKELNEIFMQAPPHIQAFVEVFGGSCHCALNISRERFKIIVCNDIDSLLINLYRYMKEEPEALIKRLALIPYSREVHAVMKSIIGDPSADPLTKAVAAFYLIRSSMNAILSESGSFRHAKNPVKRTSHAKSMAHAIAALKEYAKKFRDVALENLDYRDIIRKYDTPHTLFYLDPPYVSTGRIERESYYRHAFSIHDLRAMANLLRTIKGVFVLKISEDNYFFIKGILPQHEAVILEKANWMEKTVGEERAPIRMVIAHNVKQGKQDSEASLERWLAHEAH